MAIGPALFKTSNARQPHFSGIAKLEVLLYPSESGLKVSSISGFP